MNVSISLLLNGGTETAAGIGTAEGLNAAELELTEAEQSFQLKLAEELDSRQLHGLNEELPARAQAGQAVGLMQKAQDAGLRQQVAAILQQPAAGEDVQHETVAAVMSAESPELASAPATAALPEADPTWWEIIEKARTFSSVASLNGAAALTSVTQLTADQQIVPATGTDKLVVTIPLDPPAELPTEVMMPMALTSSEQSSGQSSLAMAQPDPALATDTTGTDAQSGLPVLTLPATQALSGGTTQKPGQDLQTHLVAAEPTVTDHKEGAATSTADSLKMVQTAGAEGGEKPQNTDAHRGAQPQLKGESVAADQPHAEPTVTKAPALTESGLQSESRAASMSASKSPDQVADNDTGRSAVDNTATPALRAKVADNELASGLSQAAKPVATADAQSSPSQSHPAEVMKSQTVSVADAPAPRKPQQAETVPAAASELAATAGPVVVTMTDATKAAVTVPNQTERSDKINASNSFAIHQKAANQQLQQLQQQKQQSDQQPSQHSQQSAAQAGNMTDNGRQIPQMSNVATFSTQLQQLTEQPAGGSSPAGAVSSLTPSPSLPAGTTPLTGKTAELPLPQTPLMLTEPHAAQQIKDRVMVQIQYKLQTAEVQLHPEDLGAMQIKLNLQQDQLSVQFVVQPGAAKEALEQQMPKLRDLLEQQGIALADSDIEERSSQQQERGHGHAGRGGQRTEEQLAERAVQISVSDRMVDYYA